MLNELDFDSEGRRRNWAPLKSANPTEVPGWYLMQSKRLAAQRWPATTGSDPWLEPGVIYIGTSSNLKRRISQLRFAVQDGRGHPAAAGYRSMSLTYLAAPPAQNDATCDVPTLAEDDVRVCWAVLRSVPAEEAHRFHRRWEAVEKATRRSLKSAMIADTMARRLTAGCEWPLLNRLDPKTF